MTLYAIAVSIFIAFHDTPCRHDAMPRRLRHDDGALLMPMPMIR